MSKSLRRKKGTPAGTRPVIGAPTQIPMPPMPGARLNAPGATPQIRSQDRDKVAEMFKKRMSTRFFVPGEIAMPDMPDMGGDMGPMGGMGGMGMMGMGGDPMGFPNPALQGGSPERPRPRPQGNRAPARQLIMPGLLEEPPHVMPVVDNDVFEQPDFNPEYFLKKKRADPSANARPRDDLPDLKLVAERCWPLSEIEMVDLSPTASEHENASRRGREAVSNAINVRVGKESFVYRNDEADVKVKLLLAFKKTKEDLRKALRAEAVDKHRLKDSLTYFTSRDPALLEQGELLQTLSNNLRDQPGLILHVDGKPRNLRWVEDQMDELDESIAHRDFDEAVRNIEKLRGVAKNLKGNILAAELINLKLDERASRLAGIITEDLMENPNQKSRVRKFVGWLTRLDFEDRAREAYLEARSGVIKKRTRQVLFEGSTQTYISSLTLIQFTLIRNTIELFCACFEHRFTSSLIRWAKGHISQFAELLDRQLAGCSEEEKRKTKDVVQSYASLLVGVGVDFFKEKDFWKGLESFREEVKEAAPVGLGVKA
ncbi:hypothetical protein BJ508DRAFT_409952 [Ascobolus immersus RN42]|uniref:Exocyst complex component EXO84 n=1 Tax=Ascobolus immersus RN42 TaxID=1160509 RepID=A0A3N4ITI4_ASCIM|nr:hypothetical protein BJ508DRAFT_409952 [Ascobolus immersus RN42]